MKRTGIRFQLEKLRRMPVLCQAPPCGRHPVGQQEVYEHEASGGRSGGRLHRWLTLFCQSLQTNLRKIADTTTGCVTAYLVLSLHGEHNTHLIAPQSYTKSHKPASVHPAM